MTKSRIDILIEYYKKIVPMFDGWFNNFRLSLNADGTESMNGFVPGMTGRQNLFLQIERGTIDVNALDNDWHTPLMHACNNGRVTIAQKIINLGADVNFIGYYGDTSLFWSSGCYGCNAPGATHKPPTQNDADDFILTEMKRRGAAATALDFALFHYSSGHSGDYKQIIELLLKHDAVAVKEENKITLQNFLQ